ncbi:MAG: hypothetical protein M3R24_18595 [Chloroflexota bacterium]|nr:hypothetical protein [Chloroflexota bacterium]
MVVEQVGVVALLPAVVPAGLPYPAPVHLTPRREVLLAAQLVGVEIPQPVERLRST